MTFLPADYEAPRTGGGYLRLVPGDNKIRILSQPIVGWEDWIDNRPQRFPMNSKPKSPADPKKPIRHFWSFIVWNYSEGEIQVMHVTSSLIRKGIESLIHSQDWGAPYHYDMIVSRKGEGLKTEYTVTPCPHKSVDPAILQAYKEKPCYLPAMFSSGDPFSPEWNEITPCMLAAKETKPANGNGEKKTVKISSEQAMQLSDQFLACDKGFQKMIWEKLHKLGVKSFSDLTPALYENIKPRILENMEVMQSQTVEEELPF